jgi:hypothetical protein
MGAARVYQGALVDFAWLFPIVLRMLKLTTQLGTLLTTLSATAGATIHADYFLNKLGEGVRHRRVQAGPGEHC